MEFENKVPEWNARGVEPPVEMKDKGFEAGYKPPASYFNWFWNRVMLCLTELFSKLKGHAEDKENPHSVSPEQIGAAEKEHSHMFAHAVIAESNEGRMYFATLEGVKALETGMSFIMIPQLTSTTDAPYLAVYGPDFEGEPEMRAIRRRLSGSMTATTIGSTEGWLAANKPVTVTFDGTYWIADLPQPNVADLYGTTAVYKGGTGRSTLTAGSYLVGNGQSNVILKTPAQVLDDIGALPEILVEGVHYGDELPSAGTKGRIFFKKVSE